jgi:hypothetical protein
VIVAMAIEQRFSTCVPRHTGVKRRVSRCAAGFWGKVGKKREKLRNKKNRRNSRSALFLKI